MATFNDILDKINTGGQIAAAIEPAIVLYGTDHITATQQILAIAAAGVAAETNDTSVQNEAVESAKLASSFVPLFFSLKSLFAKKKN